MGEPKAKLNKPMLHSYHDYVAFLVDWVGYLKATKSKFSLRHLAKESGTSVGYLSMCLKGKRRMSLPVFRKILLHLSLKRNERRFLELLWTIGESDNSADRMEALAQIQKFSQYRLSNSREIEVHKYLTKWYYPAIRELALVDDFRADPQWIQDRLRGRVSLDEVRSALQFLIESGFLVEGKKGRLEVAEKMLECKEGVYKLSLGEFHRQVMGLAAEAISTVDRSQRYILGHTLAISMQEMDKVREILDECQGKLEELGVKSANPSEVFHVELAAFPMTNPVDEGESS